MSSKRSRGRAGCGHQRSNAGLVILSSMVLTFSAACAPPPVELREPVPAPSVVWLDPPTSALPGYDRWLEALRDWDLSYATLVNTADFDDPKLMKIRGEDGVERLRDHIADDIRRGDLTIPLGPRPFAPLLVEEAPDGRSAEVFGCATRRDYLRSDLWWPDDYTVWPSPYSYTVTLDDKSRFWVSESLLNAELVAGPARELDLPVLPDGRLLTYALCADTYIPRGIYDPPPDLHRLLALDPDSIMPADSWRLPSSDSPS